MCDWDTEDVQSIAETIRYQSTSAQAKVAFSQRKSAYLISAMLAGAYIGIAVILMLTAAGPFHQAGAPATALVSGLTFSIALSLVMVAGAELVTSNMMTLTQGMTTRAISVGQGSLTMIFCFMANLLGGIVFGTFVFFSGVIKPGSGAFEYLGSYLNGKVSSTPVELFFKAILCNILVCLAIWSGLRLKSEGAKLFMIFLCLLAFITSGFEHVVANMTTFTLGMWLQVPGIGVGQFLHNLAIVGIGNLIGGMLVGLAYVHISRREVLTLDAATAEDTAQAGPSAHSAR